MIDRRLASTTAALAVAALAVVSLPPARAAAPDPSAAKGAAGQYFDLSPVGVPVVSKGRLANYVFVSVRLIVRPGVDVTKVRQKEPYVRDALVRLSSRSPLNPPSDLNRIDEAALRSRLLAACPQILGPGVVSSVQVLSQTPQRRVALPPA